MGSIGFKWVNTTNEYVQVIKPYKILCNSTTIYHMYTTDVQYWTRTANTNCFISSNTFMIPFYQLFNRFSGETLNMIFRVRKRYANIYRYTLSVPFTRTNPFSNDKYNDVMIWKRFPHYRAFLGESSVTKGCRTSSPNEWWWIQMPWWSCYVTVMDCLVDPTEGLWRPFWRDIAVDGMHYDDVTWTTCSLKSSVIQSFVEQLMWTHVKETSKSTLLTCCEENSPVAGEFPAQRTIYAEKASIWWRHHGFNVKSPSICMTETSFVTHVKLCGTFPWFDI